TLLGRFARTVRALASSVHPPRRCPSARTCGCASSTGMMENPATGTTSGGGAVFGLRRMHLPPAATGCPLGCAATHLSTTPPDQQKTANDIGENTCLSIPESQV